ncbi:MAG: carbohydrate kinase family protein [Patescibacteria group bacterium]
MFDVITIGSALVDIFIKSKDFELRKTRGGVMLCQMYDQKIAVDNFEVATGGGGGNTAVGFSRAGFTTAVISETGRDALARLVLDDLHKNCVQTSLIAQERRESTGGSAILVGSDGGRTVMVHRGASSMLDPHDIAVRPMKNSSWIHLSSIAGRILTLKKIGTIVAENKLGCSWNPGTTELELLKSGELSPSELPCQILLLNTSEWRMIQPLQKELKKIVPEIVITDGRKGGRIFVKGQRKAIQYQATSKKAIEETGAGDAFGVGYVVGRLHDREPAAAARVGARNAASVVQYFGAKAGLLHKDALLK